MKPFARPYFKLRDPRIIAARSPVMYLTRRVAQLYGFPLNYTGAGQLVGILSLGGAFSASDIQANCHANGVPTPKVTEVSIQGAQPSPDPGGADVENMLDITNVAAVAPGCEIRVYVAPNSSQGYVAALQAAVSDGCTAFSTSWGSPEDNWDAPSRAALDSLCSQAPGTTFLAAAGDNGSGDGEQGDNVDYPAASPYVLACGGTRLVVSADGGLTETVWNDGTEGGATGGGVSAYEQRPAYQAGVRVPGAGRVVPDWAGNADPATPYLIVVNGQQQFVGGTSAVAPLFAGLVALLAQATGQRTGFFNPRLYRAAATCCRDILTGNNGDYVAGVGFDACTGNGVPDGGKLLAALQGGTTPPAPPPVTPPAGAPQIMLDLSGTLTAGTYNLTPTKIN